jgi:hypothetical protein
MTYRKFTVIQGPTVSANLSIGGTVPVVDVKVVTAAIADSISVPPAIVRFVSTVHLDTTRRLLAAVMSFNVLATDADDAVLLQQKILKANMQVTSHHAHAHAHARFVLTTTKLLPNMVLTQCTRPI